MRKIMEICPSMQWVLGAVGAWKTMQGHKGSTWLGLPSPTLRRCRLGVKTAGKCLFA